MTSCLSSISYKYFLLKDHFSQMHLFSVLVMMAGRHPVAACNTSRQLSHGKPVQCPPEAVGTFWGCVKASTPLGLLQTACLGQSKPLCLSQHHMDS